MSNAVSDNCFLNHTTNRNLLIVYLLILYQSSVTESIYSSFNVSFIDNAIHNYFKSPFSPSYDLNDARLLFYLLLRSSSISQIRNTYAHFIYLRLIRALLYPQDYCHNGMLYNEQHMKDYEVYIESILKNEHEDVRLFDSIYEYLYKSKFPPNHEYVVYMSAYNATAGLLRLCNMYLDLVDYSSLYEEINGSTSKAEWNSWSIFEMMDRITQKKDSLKDFLLQFSKYININASLKLTITHILNEHSSCPYQTIRYDSASQIFASKTELTYEDLTCYSTYPLYRTRSQYRTNSDYSYQSKTSARTSFSFGSTVHSRRASSRTASCSSCSSIDNYEENAQPFVLNKNYRLMLSSYRNRLTGDIDNQIVLSSSSYVPSIYLHIQTNRLSLYQYLYDHMSFVGLFKLPYYYKDLIQYITSFVCLST